MDALLRKGGRVEKGIWGAGQKAVFWGIVQRQCGRSAGGDWSWEFGRRSSEFGVIKGDVGRAGRKLEGRKREGRKILCWVFG